MLPDRVLKVKEKICSAMSKLFSYRFYPFFYLSFRDANRKLPKLLSCVKMVKKTEVYLY